MPELSCVNLTLGYEGKPVLANLSFAVSAGDYLCVVGENGTGKSTLMKTLLRLQAPLSGEIRMSGGFRESGIGYLPQQTVIQKDFPASVREVVRSGCLRRSGMRPYYNAAEKRAAEENMEKLGIAGLASRCYRELSGGQQQRVLLARALCAAGRFLLLDEPVAGLDPLAAGELYTVIRSLNEGGVSIIMISHDIAAAVKYASHILHIGHGGPLFFGLVADYLTSEVGRAYAGGKGERD